MPFQALRFIHASNLYLDHQLQAAGVLPNRVVKTVEAATVTAFERLVVACLDQEVDFLLLTGNSFDECDRSLRARVALIHGFETLAKHDIPVFAVAGNADPLAAWRDIPGLPKNVTVCCVDSDEPIAVLRGGQVIATIGATIGPANAGTANSERSSLGSPHFSSSADQQARPASPFCIGLMNVPDDPDRSVEPWSNSAGEQRSSRESGFDANQHKTVSGHPVDYLAIGGTDVRRTLTLKHGLQHSPGSTQGRNSRHTGPHGCTCVEVDRNGAVECNFIPTAAVRCESITLTVDDHTSHDDLAETMQAALLRLPHESAELVWLLNWHVRGFGATFDSLLDVKVRDEIVELVELESPPAENVSWVHHFRSLPVNEADRDNFHNNRFAAEYFEHLDRESSASSETLRHCLDRAALPEGPWFERLQSLADGLNHETVTAHARRQGLAWFASLPEEGSSS